MREVVNCNIETKFGIFNVYVWKEEFGREPVALVTPQFDPRKSVLVRVHSECITGDNFGSLKCDCGGQKQKALELIAKKGNGIFIYHRQEGRGIGLFEKIRAYKLQKEGLDTKQANIALGHKADAREYENVKKILSYFKVKEIDLLTNNPQKVAEIEKSGVRVNQIPLITQSNPHNIKYLETKIKEFNHSLTLK